MSELDDIALVNRCLQGHTEAFAQLVDRYQGPIFNVALRMLNNFDDAEDVAQSVFVKAFERLLSFDPKYKFFSWIYRMAVNESINFMSKRKPVEAMPAQVVAPDKRPDERFDDQELNERVHRAIMELQIDYRAVIILKHFEEFSYQEIGFILEIPEKTVKSRLFTSRRQLRDILLKRGIVSQ